ncbi:helix-turn-helix domain-containing protein [Bacteroides sedimenti]|uniref:Transcriptional regulator n=1 Tax=Bacteroides sedimenti TaxID=2136147 RepID=A0ABN6ZCK3_9BACE
MISIKQIKSISELQLSDTELNKMREKINCVTISYIDIRSQLSSPIHINATIAILVLSGTATLCVNYKEYHLTVNSITVLSSSHLLLFSECSSDFTAQSLFVSKEFMDEMDSTDMIYKRIKYGVRLYSTPVIQLQNNQSSLLSARIASINSTIDNPDHLYYKEMILNSLFAFYLDLSNIIDRTSDSNNDGNFTRYENIIKSFIGLLIENYRKEHKVDFYASQLNITTHYLTLVVKRITGQSVSDFIFEMLYSEARQLLTHSKLSIQEIAFTLSFSDQSSFSKFFKRKSGVSPVEFRKGDNLK